MVGLPCIICQIILLMNRLVSYHADFVIMLAGGLIDNAVLIEGVDHVHKSGL